MGPEKHSARSVRVPDLDKQLKSLQRCSNASGENISLQENQTAGTS